MEVSTKSHPHFRTDAYCLRSLARWSHAANVLPPDRFYRCEVNTMEPTTWLDVAQSAHVSEAAGFEASWQLKRRTTV